MTPGQSTTGPFLFGVALLVLRMGKALLIGVLKRTLFHNTKARQQWSAELNILFVKRKYDISNCYYISVFLKSFFAPF